VDFLDLPANSNPVDASGAVTLTGNHTVAGNPNRFDTGSVKIRADDEWMRAMPRRQQLLLGSAVLPLIRKYGYPLRSWNSGAS
jgi:hypothetical protein